MAPKDSIERFNGTNFHTWQTKLKFHLMKKGLWDIVQGTEDPRPQTREGTIQVEFKTHKALGIIGESLHDTYIHHIGNCKAAKEAWTILDKTFGTISKVSKIILLSNSLDYKKITLNQCRNI